MARETPLDPDDPATILRCLRALDRGEPVGVPDDATYLVAADALREAAVERVVELTDRRGDELLAVMAGNLHGVQHVAELTSMGKRLADRFLPGGLTLVLPARGTTPPNLAGTEGEVAVTVPSGPFPRRLAERFGPLVTAPGRRDAVPLCVDGDPRGGGAPRTVVDARGDAPKVIRVGAVPEHDLVETHG